MGVNVGREALYTRVSENMLSPMFATLLEAARWAPSGDNTQPWQFIVDEEASTIELRIDASRDPSPMNAGQRMARIAIGAAIQNITRTAAANGWNVCVREPVEQQRVILEVHGYREVSGTIESALRQRCSNRRRYDGGELPVEMVARLNESLAGEAGVEAAWITDRVHIEKAADVIGEADAMMFASQRVRRAFFEKIRFDLPACAEAAEGLSLGSLELSLADRISLPLLPRLSERGFTWTGARRTLRNKARGLVRSSSGLLVLSRQGGAESDYDVGRRFQTAWLAVAEQGLCAQPMMSLPVLDNLCKNDESCCGDADFCAAVEVLTERFRCAMGRPELGQIGAILRFGRGQGPTSRVGRRAVCDAHHSAANEHLPAGVA